MALLGVLLLVWEPLSFAWSASLAFSRVIGLGWFAVALLVFRAVAAALCVAAGRAVFARADHAVALARVALGLTAVGVVAANLTSYFPSNAAPSERPWRLAASLAYYCVWSVVLLRARAAADATPS